MITIDDLKNAADKLEAEYYNKLLPMRVEAYSALTALLSQYNDANIRIVAERHGISLALPCFCGGDWDKVYSPNTRLFLNSIIKGDVQKSIIAWHGYSDAAYAGAPVGSTLWYLLQNAYPFRTFNAKYNFLCDKRKLFDQYYDGYNNGFVGYLNVCKNEVQRTLDRIRKLDEEDTKEFNALFSRTPEVKKYRISVLIERVD